MKRTRPRLLAAAFAAFLAVSAGAASSSAATIYPGAANGGSTAPSDATWTVGGGGHAMSAGSATAASAAADADKAMPSIMSANCTPQLAPWVHLYSPDKTGCYAGFGTLYIPSVFATKFCAGNNYGTFKYRVMDGNVAVAFKPGQTFYLGTGVYVWQIMIQGWTDKGTCPMT